MKSKLIKTYNLPSDNNIIYRLEVKPSFILIIIFILGMLFLYNSPSIALFMIATAVFGLLCLPSHVLLEFYDNYLVLYNRASKFDCVMIYYEEIISWEYRKGHKVDCLIISTTDGKIEKIDLFNRYMVTKYLKDFAADKEVK